MFHTMAFIMRFFFCYSYLCSIQNTDIRYTQYSLLTAVAALIFLCHFTCFSFSNFLHSLSTARALVICIVWLVWATFIFLIFWVIFINEAYRYETFRKKFIQRHFVYLSQYGCRYVMKNKNKSHNRKSFSFHLQYYIYRNRYFVSIFKQKIKEKNNTHTFYRLFKEYFLIFSW